MAAIELAPNHRAHGALLDAGFRRHDGYVFAVASSSPRR